MINDLRIADSHRNHPRPGCRENRHIVLGCQVEPRRDLAAVSPLDAARPGFRDAAKWHEHSDLDSCGPARCIAV